MVAQQLTRSISAPRQRVRELPPDTLVWPGHEYGLSNLLFAESVDPENAALAAKLAEARKRKAGRQALVPSTLQAERQFNPFLRYDQPPLTALKPGADSATTLLHLRSLKVRVGKGGREGVKWRESRSRWHTSPPPSLSRTTSRPSCRHLPIGNSFHLPQHTVRRMAVHLS